MIPWKWEVLNCRWIHRDEEIVVFHDAYVDRTSNGAGRVSSSQASMIHRSTAKADIFQIPPQYNNIPLDKKGFIDYLQSLNVAVGYWVINEMDEMDELIQKGAHTIVTDYPDISHHLMKERY